MSASSKLPKSAVPEGWNSKESWRVFGIMSEFVSATDRLNQIQLLGSAGWTAQGDAVLVLPG